MEIKWILDKLKKVWYYKNMGKKFYKHEYKGKYKFIRNWFDDREGAEFERKIDEWLAQFDDEEQDFLLECLENYSYFRAAEYRHAIKNLYKDFDSKNPNWKEHSKIFMMNRENGRVSNSNGFFVDFWKINNIKNECKYELDQFKDCFDLIDNIVFVDDYIGTGNSIVTYLENQLKKFPMLKFKSIHILCLYLTKSGELALKNYATDNTLSLKLYYYKKGDKFFKEGHYYSGNNLIEKIEMYSRIWDGKFTVPSYKFGYGDIQSLCSINDNTPNNTLGIFWKKSSTYNPLFERYHEDFTSLDYLIRERKLTSMIKKEQLWKDQIDSHQNLLFVGYCARKKIVFDFNDACKRFNLTEKQLNEKIDYVIDKGYIEIKRSRFVETEKFWQSVKRRKCQKYFEDFINGVIEEKTLDLKTTNYLPVDFEKRFTEYK